MNWDRSQARHGADHRSSTTPTSSAELLDRIRRDGPLSSTDIEPRASIDWYWRPTNQVRAVLEALAEAGILGISRREGNRRIYDLAERLFPPALLAETRPPRDQFRHKLLSRYRANGLLGRSGLRRALDRHDALCHRQDQACGIADPAGSCGPGWSTPASWCRSPSTGVKGERYVIRDDRPLLEAVAARVTDRRRARAVAFLGPLDPFVWDRDLLRSLYDFDYIWEVYVPGPKRRWGYYVLPLLFGDRISSDASNRGPTGATEVLRDHGRLVGDRLRSVRGAAGFIEAFVAALTAQARSSGPRGSPGRASLGIATSGARCGPGSDPEGRLRA